MLQTHVVGRSYKNTALQLLARHSVIHNLVALRMISESREFSPKLGQRLRALIIERGTVAERPLLQTRLAHYTFHELSNSHSGGNSVRVDNHIWTQSVARKWHISLRNNIAASSFLTRPGGHFVA